MFGLESINAKDMWGISTQLFTGVVGSGIAYLVYQQTAQSAEGSWDKNFSELHIEFWKDADIAKVRTWLDNPDAYSKIKPIFEKIMKIENPEKAETGKLTISEIEYETIDKYDKFLNSISRIMHLVPKSKKQSVMLKNLFFSHWVNRCFNNDKEELLWYAYKHYKMLFWFVHGNYPELKIDLENYHKKIVENNKFKK